MSGFSFYIKDFGCRINQYDARLIKKNLAGMGKIPATLEEADVVLINTCSVTHRASSDAVRFARKIKNAYPDKEILAIGCSAREGNNGFVEAGIKTLPQFKYLDNSKTNIDEFDGHRRAFIKIQQGCKGSCAYCIVKKLKKPYYIKSVASVMEEIRELSVKHPEVVICATNFNEYPDMIALVRGIGELTGDFRWRFSSLPAACITDEVIDLLSKDKRFCPHFHIPVQSGSDVILEKMKRGYTIDQVNAAIELAGKKLGNVAFSFDVIVGFPGETNEDYNETIEFIKKTKPVKVHAFRYSERPGTEACNYEKKVPENIKKERISELIDISENIRNKHFEDALGKIKEVVIERDKSGYTRDYLPVTIAGNDSQLPGYFRNVKITEFKNECLLGIVV
jgi:threonylcarbamoyladenosine tRNA methylthiotransferase MtaB